METTGSIPAATTTARRHAPPTRTHPALARSPAREARDASATSFLALQRARTASIAKGAARPTSTRPPQNGREHAPFSKEATDANAAASVGVAPEEVEPPCSNHAAPSHSVTTTASRARRIISARTTCRIVRPKTVAIPENAATMPTSATPHERAEIANSPGNHGPNHNGTDGIPDSNSPV